MALLRDERPRLYLGGQLDLEPPSSPVVRNDLRCGADLDDRARPGEICLVISDRLGWSYDAFRGACVQSMPAKPLYESELIRTAPL
jgi:hypothetical protein